MFDGDPPPGVSSSNTGDDVSKRLRLVIELLDQFHRLVTVQKIVVELVSERLQGR